MYAAKVPLRKAEKVKTILIEKELMDRTRMPIKEFGFMYFPITRRVKVSGANISSIKLPEKKGLVSVEEMLKGKLNKKELGLLPSSQEIIGSILILEIPEELIAKEKLIAEAYLKFHHNVETVVKKQHIHAGIFRTRKVKILAGKRSKETTHVENGVKLNLHLEQTYFSGRSANERLRIAKLVKKGEEVLVMFSGIAPFPLVLAANSLAKRIIGIEINSMAHSYAMANIDQNNMVGRVAIYLGDVSTVLPKLRRKFNRIVMPLPKTSEQYLYLALPKLIQGGIIHFYSFAREEEIASEAKRLSKKCKDLGCPIKVVRKVKCGNFSPGVFRVCFDLRK
jgi:tRNA (guanine37-N1)-methyltransferase